MKVSRILVAGLGLALALSMGACSSTPAAPGASGSPAPAASSGGGAAAGNGELIGVSMPTKSLQRWNLDGSHLEDALKAAGYTVSLQYADNKVDEQVSQIQNMINAGAKVLVIAAVDGTSLTAVLQQAANSGAKVIAYDRLIMNTPNVDYYDTFDNYKVGTLQGNYIVDQLGLKNDTSKTYTFEPFAGDPADNNAPFFFAGAWDVLSPYVTSGQLKVLSGNTPANDDDWKKIGVPGWDTSKAQSNMQTRLNTYYTSQKVQVVLSPNDSLALGIEQALDAAGYSSSDWPLITGQDCDVPNTKNILAGKQSMCVWKNTPLEGDQAVKMVQGILGGTEVPVNDTKTYNNGQKVVPSFLSDPQVVTKDTVQSVLVGSGFYTADQLGLS